MTIGFFANPSKYDLHVTQQHQQCSSLLLIMEGMQTRLYRRCFKTHLCIEYVLQLQYKLSAIVLDLDSRNVLQQCPQLTWSPITAVADAGGVGRGVRGAPQADRTTGPVDPSVALPQSALLPTLQRVLIQSCSR